MDATQRLQYVHRVKKNIPRVLQGAPQWVVWKLVPRSDKSAKVPYCARTHKAASVSNRDTWSTLEEALAAFNSQHDYSGVGFVFTKEDQFCGIDLDHCRELEDGTIQSKAEKIINEIDAYTEISPSGTGVHILCTGTLAPGRRRSDGLEIYDHGRFFTVTGDAIRRPGDLLDRQNQLATLCQRELATSRSVVKPVMREQRNA